VTLWGEPRQPALVQPLCRVMQLTAVWWLSVYCTLECELIAEQTDTADGPRVKVLRGVKPCSFSTYIDASEEHTSAMFKAKSRNYTTHINPRRQIAVATKFCAVAPNIYWFSVWNKLAPIIVIWVRLLETLCTLGLDVPPTSVLLTATYCSRSSVRVKFATNSLRYMTTLRSHRISLGLLACRRMFGAL